ncbi:NACHT ankyrin domain-containing protein [Fusarium pseudocircinatum]|uniref:NACHT ankyrin domain-containing protein n=1 Tax=Fusarium pseudocircinatum TaxID=56676 RepID=A0A8H5PK82_9HYPO|nr:NACHT ankyrin domain-containing protein [Fusarium pseudocircinatum]
MSTEHSDRDLMVSPGSQQNIHDITATNGSYLFAGNVRNVRFSQPRQAAPSFEEIIKKCRDVLFISHPDADMASIAETKGQRAPRTCEWILRNSHYQAWIDKKSPLFWISGGPGTGKTVMSLFLAEQIEERCQETDDHLVCYFCRFQHEYYNKPENLLRNLTYQLLSFATDISKVQEVFSYLDTPEKAEKALSSLECLWRILIILLSQSDLSTVYCIIDGIDECLSSHALISKFRDYCMSSIGSNGPLRLALLGRDVDILGIPLHSQGLKCSPDATPDAAFIETDVMVVSNGIQVDRYYGGHINDDITTFIRWSLEPLQRIHDFEAIRPQIEQTLLTRAEGTFLWASFVIHELLKKKTRLQVLETVQDLPAGLHPIFGRMLRQVDPSHHHTTVSILKWIAVAMRPLILGELAYAIGQDIEGMADRITICQPLLRISDDRVLFIHQCAKEYLLRDQPDDDPITESFRIEASECHGEIAHKCLQILEQSCLQFEGFARKSFDYDTVPPELQTMCKLFNYAEFHWMVHARLSPPSAKYLFNFSRPFFKRSSAIRKNWAVLHGMPSQRLQMASFLGIVPWPQALWEEVGTMRFLGTRRWKKWVNAEGDLTPLEYAVQGGNEDAVRFLLEHDADRAVDLYAAFDNSLHPNYNITDVLIQYGVRLGRSRSSRTPLMDAATEGFTEVLRVLLEQGADINYRNHEDETALVLTAVFGHKDAFDFLLGHDAHVDIADFRTWLRLTSQIPRSGWSTGIVQTFVQLLTDICWLGEDGSRLLILATNFGDFEVVQLCLAEGVDVNWKHPNGTTALIAAVIEHRSPGPAYTPLIECAVDSRIRDPTHPYTYYLPSDLFRVNLFDPSRIAERSAIVAILLHQGANVNLCADLQDGLYPPLVVAAIVGVDFAIAELIEHGADCNVRSRFIRKPEPRSGLLSSLFGSILPQPEDDSTIEGGSALIQAARMGYVSTVRLLLAYGADADLVDEHGRTALECAFEKGHEEIQQVLMEHYETFGSSSRW